MVSREHHRYLDCKVTLRRAIRLGILALGASSPLLAQESVNFGVERLTGAALAGRMSSASYVNTVSVSGLAGSAAHCPSGSGVRLGFWASLDSGSFPMILRLGKDPLISGRVLLNWTGQAPGFRVHRSGSPQNVLAAQNLLLSTGACAASDAAAPPLAFYVVQAAGGATP